MAELTTSRDTTEQSEADQAKAREQKRKEEYLCRGPNRFWMIRGALLSLGLLAAMCGLAGIYYAIQPAKVRFNYLQSLFFMFETYTTIGYGSYAPVTSGGRAFISITALVFVPIFFTTLIFFFNPFLNWVAARLRRRLKKIPRLHKTWLTQEDTTALQLLIVALVQAAAIPIFAFIFTLLVEEWNYGDSVYFSIVSVLTVGYGDLVPDTDLSKGICIIFMVISATIQAMIIGLTSSIYTNRVTKSRLKRRFRLRELKLLREKKRLELQLERQIGANNLQAAADIDEDDTIARDEDDNT